MNTPFKKKHKKYKVLFLDFNQIHQQYRKILKIN